MVVDRSGSYLLPTVVRTHAPVGQKPHHPRRGLARSPLKAMSGTTPEGKLLMGEQERAFKGEDVVRFLEHGLRAGYRASRRSLGGLAHPSL